MKLYEQQEKALKAALAWYKGWKPGGKPYFYLGGYAGCGKTTIAEFFEAELGDNPGRIVRCAYTGKAAMRMQQVTGKAANTIHSCIYKLVENKKGEPVFELNKHDSPITGAKLVVLDECSMVNDDIGKDLFSFNVPILVLGDPGQLPPPQGAGFFTKHKPDVMLTEVHRQALESPIIRVATDIRNGKPLIRMSEPGCNIYPYSKDFDMEQELLLADQVLTGRNTVRISINHKLRDLHGYADDYPELGDKLICIRNNRKLNIFNGLLANVVNIRESSDDRVLLDMETEIGRRDNLDIIPECFTNMADVQSMPFNDRKDFCEFDWGYCITVHKSQGSQWDKLLLLDDGFLNWKKEDRKKWLYTAVTRAATDLTVINRGI